MSLMKLFIISLPFIAFGINAGSDTITLSFVLIFVLTAFYLLNKLSIPLPADDVTVLFYIFLIFAAFTSYHSIMTYRFYDTLLGDTPEAKDLKQIIMLLFMLVHFIVLRLILRKFNMSQVQNLIWFFIYVSLAVSVYSLYQFIALKYELPFGDILRNTKSYSMALASEKSSWLSTGMVRTRAFMPESSFWGAYLLVPISLLLPFAFSRRNLRTSLMLFIFLLAMFLSFSRTGWLALAILIVLFLYQKLVQDKMLYRVINIVLYTSLFILLLTNFILPNLIETISSFADYSATVRFSTQKISFLTFLKYPLLGVGWANTGFFISDISTYNFYLQLLLETGIIGFLIFTVFLYKIFRKLSRVEKALLAEAGATAEIDTVFGIKLAYLSILIVWFNSAAYNCSYIWFFIALSAALPNVMNNSHK